MATIRIIKGRVYYDFYFKGVRCTENADFEATKDNLKKAKKYAQPDSGGDCKTASFSMKDIFPMGPKSSSLHPSGKTNPSTGTSPTGWPGRS